MVASKYAKKVHYAFFLINLKNYYDRQKYDRASLSFFKWSKFIISWSRFIWGGDGTCRLNKGEIRLRLGY